MMVVFRRAVSDDIDFILELKEKCFKGYIEKIYHWDIEHQKELTEKEMKDKIEGMRIVQYENRDIGLLTSSMDNNGDLCVGMFALLPMYQKREIGGRILRKFMEENRNKRIYLKTYKENPARHLYEREGFKIYDETSTHFLMEYNQLKKNLKEIFIDDELKLIPYFRNTEVTFDWYQDLELCRQVDNIDFTYSMNRLNAMYDYLSTNGECYYIEFMGNLVGDVTLLDNFEVAIVVSKEYQNRAIGRRCIKAMVDRAREKGASKVSANIYSFNAQSRKMFGKLGFVEIKEEYFELKL